MSEKIGNRGIRWLIAGGVALMFVGGCVAGFADGFGDAPPLLAESRRQRRIGGAILALGVVAAVGSAIGLYVIENRASRRNPGDRAESRQHVGSDVRKQRWVAYRVALFRLHPVYRRDRPVVVRWTPRRCDVSNRFADSVKGLSMFRTERGVQFLVLASSLLLVGACIAYEGGGIYQQNRLIMHGSKSKMLGPAVLKAQETAVSAASDGAAETNRDEPKSEEEPE